MGAAHAVSELHELPLQIPRRLSRQTRRFEVAAPFGLHAMATHAGHVHHPALLGIAWQGSDHGSPLRFRRRFPRSYGLLLPIGEEVFVFLLSRGRLGTSGLADLLHLRRGLGFRKLMHAGHDPQTGEAEESDRHSVADKRHAHLVSESIRCLRLI